MSLEEESEFQHDQKIQEVIEFQNQVREIAIENRVAIGADESLGLYSSRIVDHGDNDDEVVQRKSHFDVNLIRNYPKCCQRLHLNVAAYGLHVAADQGQDGENAQSINISPYGIEFKTSEYLKEGELIKVKVKLPDFWERKKRFVSYGRIDAPSDFRILARVVSSVEIGKRGKKNFISAQTLVMDEVDEQVLKHFLQEG
jgi:hypothetical protein